MRFDIVMPISICIVSLILAIVLLTILYTARNEKMYRNANAATAKKKDPRHSSIKY